MSTNGRPTPQTCVAHAPDAILSEQQTETIDLRLRVVSLALTQGHVWLARNEFDALCESLERELSGESQDGDDTYVTHLGLATREANAIERYGLTTVGALRAKLATAEGRRELLAIQGVGATVLASLFARLRAFDEHNGRSPSLPRGRK